MYKKKAEESKGGAPEWMNTYGDLVTLLLCFFVLLFAMSSVDSAKVAQLVESYARDTKSLLSNGSADGISDLLGSGIIETPTSKARPSSNTNANRARAEAEMVKMASNFKTYFAENNFEEKIEIKQTEDSIMLSFKDGVLFDSGKANLKPESLVALNIVADELLKYPDNQIEIQGHTDNVPIKTIQFPDNWFLSAARAINVGSYFIDSKGVSPSRIITTGRGEYVPKAPNDTPENRAINRRVEIIIKSRIATNNNSGLQ